MRKLLTIITLYLLFSPGVSAGEEFYENQLNSGIRNYDEYSFVLIKQAHENRAEASKILQKAITSSPDLPAVYFEMSKASFSLSSGAILDVIDYIIEGINAYFRNFWWSFTLAGVLFFSLVFSFLLTIILILITRLPGDISLISHDIKEDNSNVLFLPGLVLLSIISPLFFLAGILILLSIYMRKIDRIVVYLFLVFLLFSPLILKTSSLFINAPSSGKIKSIVQVNESKGNNYAISALKNNNDYTALFSYALALKRAGSYEEAIAIYNRLIDTRPDPKVYVNLGNCYVGLYNLEEEKKFNLEEAVKYYSMAINIKPLASAYYNLSQISRELLDFKKGDEYFVSAVAADRTAVSSYRTIYGRNPNRLVVDETLTFDELWDYVTAKSERVSSFGMTIIPVSLISVMSLALIAAVYLLNKRLKSKAYRCRRCSTILCTKCEKRLMWGQMCPQCYRSLVKLDEQDSRERVATLLSIYAHQKKRRDTMKILSFILPGASQVYAGKILYGFIFMWPFLFFLLIPLTNSIFITDSSLLSHGFFKWTAVFIAVLLYIVSNMITRQRIAKGWL